MLLSIQNLSVSVGDKMIVDDVCLKIPQETITALVGGSGSGKTTTGLSILKLLAPGLTIKGGKTVFNGTDLWSLPESRLRDIRGKEISVIFQDPLNAFNPVFTIFSQIDEVLQHHTDLPAKVRQERVHAMLDMAGIPDPKRVAGSYPHQLSGGMRQRAMIAQAIAAEPKLLIADEPTSNLDVTLQARMMQLFRELRDKLKLSILLITHDLGIVQHLSDETSVMLEGKIVESGKTKEVLSRPQHDYTRKLMKAVKL